LEDLGLKDEPLPTAGQDLTDLPEFGSFDPPPQPGPFRFKLPMDLGAIYDVFDGSGIAQGQQRVRAVFDREHPLLIEQSLGGKYNGQPFQTRISNNERNRGKKGSGIVASDWDYLLRAFGIKTKPANNKEYITALRGQAGKSFGADLRYSWRCSADRDIRVKDKDGAVQVVENHKGCDEAFYQEDVPKSPDGTTPYEITCACGAILRAFANLDNIRP
jgi:hypothetical protein